MSWNWKTIAVLMALLLSLVGNLMFFTKSIELKKTIASYQDIESLNARSEDFVKAYINGKSDQYLTADAQARFKKASDEAGHDNHNPTGDSGLSKIEISQLFTKPIANTTGQAESAESYASVKLQYDMGISEAYSDDYFQDITVKSKWIKEAGIWKVNDVSVSVQKDSNDDQLREQAERALENAAGTGGTAQ